MHWVIAAIAALWLLPALLVLLLAFLIAVQKRSSGLILALRQRRNDHNAGDEQAPLPS